jgi:gas vesicle protein
MDNNDSGSSGVGFLSGLVIGAFAGAILALVLAPQSGEETRELIMGKAQEAKGRALDVASDLRDLAGQLADDLRKQADELSKKTRTAYETTAKRADNAVHAAKNAAQAKIDEIQNG